MAKILILDDMPDLVALVERLLRTMGHNAHGFTEEEEAIAFARSDDVDLAILDIKLKKMNGLDVLEELRKINPQMRAIILTAYPTLDTAQRALSLGAEDYCVKPFEQYELEEKVEAALGPFP